jgi:hypothetical protein
LPLRIANRVSHSSRKRSRHGPLHTMSVIFRPRRFVQLDARHRNRPPLGVCIGKWAYGRRGSFTRGRPRGRRLMIRADGSSSTTGVRPSFSSECTSFHSFASRRGFTRLLCADRCLLSRTMPIQVQENRLTPVSSSPNPQDFLLRELGQFTYV